MMRQAAAIGIIALASLAAALNLFDAAAQQPADPYRIDVQVRRISAFTSVLPADAKRVGYVSDMDIATPRGQLAYQAAVYALAPRLVVPVAKASPGDFVLGNYSAPRDYQVAGLTLQQDLGTGLIVYRKAAP